MRDLRTLVIMQLKARTNLALWRSLRRILFTIGLGVVLFASVTLVVNWLFGVFASYRIVSNINIIPTNFMVFIFFVLLTISLSTSTYSLTKSFYFDLDNKILLTFPVKSNIVFFSKLIVFFITDFRRNAFLMLPFFLAFGITNGLGFLFYLVLIFGFIFLSIFLTVLAATLSIPLMYIMMVFKRIKILQVTLLVGALIFATVLIVRVINEIPRNINIAQDYLTYSSHIMAFLQDFENALGFLARIPLMLVGEITFIARFEHHVFPIESLYTLLVILGSTIVLGLFIWFIIRNLYFKMAASSFEKKTTPRKAKASNKQLSPVRSVMKRESLSLYRDPSTVFSSAIYMYLMPLAMLLLNGIFAALDTVTVGKNMALAANILVLLLIVLQNNTMAASVFSREGSGFHLNKAKPVKPWLILAVKMFIYTALTSVSLLISVIFLVRIGGVATNHAVQIYILVMLLYLAHMLWSFDLDLSNPQHKKYDGGNFTNNPNETKSSIIGFVLAFIIFVAALTFLMENSATAIWKTIGIAIIILVARIFLNRARMKVLYKNL